MMRKKKTDNGFTLIEIMIVMLIIAVISAGILSMQRLLVSTKVFGFGTSNAIGIAGFTINQIGKEIRTLRNADNGSYPIVYGDDNEFIFYSDADADGSSERIRYFLQDNVLRKGVIKPMGYPPVYESSQEEIKVVTDKVENYGSPMFIYFNGEWPQDTQNNPLPTPINIAELRLVKIYLNISERENSDKEDYEVSTSIHLRTLKDNL